MRSVCSHLLFLGFELVTLLLVGCSTINLKHPRELSTASAASVSTPMGALSARISAGHPGQSGFYLLSGGVEAFAARIALIENARESIDLQYYIIHGDESGKLIIEGLLAAADRGVRVRILVDDIYVAGADSKIAALDLHAKIEIRLFNPWKYRGNGLVHSLNFLADSGRLNHRMHNKLFAVDNAAMVMGGRNLGDAYFGLNEGFTFSDLDVLAIGPITAEASQHFDRYWNSEWAVPVADRQNSPPTAADLNHLRADLAAHRETVRHSRFGLSAADSEIVHQLREQRLQLIYAPATVLADDPNKVVSDRKRDRAKFLMAQIQRATPRAQRELLVCSPYFVPGQEGLHYFESLSTNGVDVRILTNAQEAGDVSVVHSGYAPYRVPLLRAGVRLHELKRTSDPSRQTYQSKKFGSANASLHTKCFISDRRHVFIGSMNLDPRSIQRNTETGLIIESEEMGQMLGGLFERGTAPDASYEVILRHGPASPSADLEWITTDEGRNLRFKTEPGTSWFQRFKVKLMRLLPIESQI